MTSSTGEALAARRDSVWFVDRPRGGTISSSTRRRPRFPADPAATDRQRRARDDRRTAGDADDDESDRSRAECGGGGGGGGIRTLTSWHRPPPFTK